jgi:hypothetical protein
LVYLDVYANLVRVENTVCSLKNTTEVVLKNMAVDVSFAISCEKNSHQQKKYVWDQNFDFLEVNY